jgi:hypothetical protein
MLTEINYVSDQTYGMVLAHGNLMGYSGIVMVETLILLFCDTL